mmetsp:Transcript_3031/g.5366  ORF Transcript_3031/g.5366 Transcript_3031/m.5366 type:complete len:201 (-) Transcript_3031:485-1087(-)
MMETRGLERLREEWHPLLLAKHNLRGVALQQQQPRPVHLVEVVVNHQVLGHRQLLHLARLTRHQQQPHRCNPQVLEVTSHQVLGHRQHLHLAHLVRRQPHRAQVSGHPQQLLPHRPLGQQLPLRLDLVLRHFLQRVSRHQHSEAVWIQMHPPLHHPLAVTATVVDKEVVINSHVNSSPAVDATLAIDVNFLTKWVAELEL